MKKLFLLVCILGMFVMVGSSIAETKPRAILDEGRIYLLFDLETNALCYITSMGGIYCTHQGNLSMSDRISEIIMKEIKKYHERKGSPPHMIPLNQDPIPTPKKKDGKL